MVRTLDAPEWLVHVCWYGALSVGGGVGCCLLGAVGTFTADCCRAPTVGRAVAGVGVGGPCIRVLQYIALYCDTCPLPVS